MLRAIYDPGDGYPDTPLLAEVSGCEHADQVMKEMDGALKSSPRGSLVLWEALQREVENYLQDQYTDRLEMSPKYRRLRDEP